MNILEKHWQIHPHITPEAEKNLAGFPPFLRQVLFNRGFGTAEESKESEIGKREDHGLVAVWHGDGRANYAGDDGKQYHNTNNQQGSLIHVYFPKWNSLG